MKHKFINLISILYSKKCVIYTYIIFLILNFFQIHFDHCLRVVGLFSFIKHMMIFFLGLSVILLILNLIFVSLVLKNKFLVKDLTQPSRIGEFKDKYIITPFIIMGLIGFIKLLLLIIDLPYCKLNENINTSVYIILLMEFLLSIKINKIYFYYKKVQKNIKYFKKINFLLLNMVFIFIFFMVLNIIFLHENQNDQSINILMYSLFMYIGFVGFCSVKRKIKYKLKWDDIIEIFRYIIIFIILFLIYCYPDFLKKVILFFNCIKNQSVS